MYERVEFISVQNRMVCLSAAPRHQVNGLLQFVPQFVFATITVSVQRRQDLREEKREVVTGDYTLREEFCNWAEIKL